MNFMKKEDKVQYLGRECVVYKVRGYQALLQYTSNGRVVDHVVDSSKFKIVDGVWVEMSEVEFVYKTGRA